MANAPSRRPRTAAKREPAKTQSNALRRPSPRPARVVYVISDLSVGGAEIMLYELLAETNGARFEPVVVSLMDGGALRGRVEALGVEVHTLGINPRRPTPLDLWRFIRLTRRL